MYEIIIITGKDTYLGSNYYHITNTADIWLYHYYNVRGYSYHITCIADI